MWRVSGIPADTESFVSTVLVNEAIRRQTPEGAAMSGR